MQKNLTKSQKEKKYQKTTETKTIHAFQNEFQKIEKQEKTEHIPQKKTELTYSKKRKGLNEKSGKNEKQNEHKKNKTKQIRIKTTNDQNNNSKQPKNTHKK